MHGQFVWYELTTPDPEAAMKFYPRLTNWGTQRFDDDYMMWTQDGIPFAGLFRLNDEMKARGTPPNWMPYIETSDVDGTSSKAKSLGATIIVEPNDIPGTGRIAVVRDPQGAVFGIYKPFNQSIAWNGNPVLGKPSWHELMTSDHEAAEKFYSALFNWEKISEMDMGGGQMYHMFGQKGGSGMYGGMFSMNDEWKGMHPFWLVYFHVKDVGKAVESATKNGATIQRPQMDIPGGSIAILGDPQGAGFAVHHAPPAVATRAAVAVRAAVKKATDTVRAAVKKAGPKVKAAVTKARPKAKAKAKRAPQAKPKARTKSKAKTAARKPTRAATRKSVKAPARKKARASASKTARASARKTTRTPARKKAKAAPRKKAARSVRRTATRKK
jgi:predicted enzyme related to lactoylglutathione lyase